jgi:flagella basal body P-ring formation protein FlgA
VPVQQEPVIRRGDPVELAAGDASFRVTSEVIAEQDGAPGDRIRVRADRKSPPMMAEVVSAGKARLPGFK